ncbi:MAG: hypothetical protein WD934_01510 [Gemmatimonadales bacterium]
MRLLVLAAIALPMALHAQSREPQGRTIRSELSLGFGSVGSDLGFGGRVTFVYLPRRWGFWLRQAGHIGAEGPLECVGADCTRKRQMFYDSGLLLGTQFFRENAFRVVGGIGIGIFGGTAPELDPSGNRRLESFTNLGFPLEVGLYTANRGPLGAGILFTGNMNKRIAQFGVMLAGSVGRWR